jgi:long-subunit fatty acid transport protein
MKCFFNRFRNLFVLFALFFLNETPAQENNSDINHPTQFWDKVQFGGGIGLGFGSGFTDISLAPSAIYNINEYGSIGLGLQYKYLKQQNSFASHLYGGSVIGLLNPLPEIQLSAELEQLRVNVNLDGSNSNSQSFWNTGLFVGAGYRSGFATMGVRYNVLQDENNIYGSRFMPFVRFYF